VTDPRCLVAAGRHLHEEIDRIDALASRFRDDSEISQLNRMAGRRMQVNPELSTLIHVAVAMAEATDGAVDPTVGAAMSRLGYDRDFAEIVGGVDGKLPEPRPVPGWRNVELDIEAGAVFVPAGVALDLGATAKAWAADRVASSGAAVLGCGVLVSLGGDIAVGGTAPDGGFSIGLADVCTEDEPIERVAIGSGGLATSGLANRRWRLGVHGVHHIVDPSTGLPAVTPWRTVSVAAASCVEANAASTAAVVKGEPAVDWLTSVGLPARLVSHRGDVRVTAGWPVIEHAGGARERGPE
jgi:thiamine biosynthesis lipoprotein ApbE